ncbi:MFS transporter [Terricaulis silvestris]|uniref:Proline porter II n=1 Tax=Terricaulis silvestris TaxID=2686094 RepID=A0A6I6N0P7_9CAUL|nr:MFS transporter [Terricaulis silvestris]QGZ96903.1 Proline porter II [Terricaulis silvestris]
MTDAPASSQTSPEVSPAKMRQVVAASAAGTVFEWYDFFVYGALASVMSAHFFAGLPDAQAFVFTLLTFAVGFIVRPLGALVFGKIGDSTGRKGAFLITITIMGLATFAIGLLPTAEDIGVWAPILLVAMRVLQGFALGGEYGGAAIYVAEHAHPKRRGAATGWIQGTASIGLIGALGVVLGSRALLGEEAFREWGWRIPFLISIGLLGVSVWIRLQLEESPAFKKLQDEGKVSKRAYAESFTEWPNLRIVLLALFGVMMAQGVVWYTAHFYSQFYLERILKIDSQSVNLIMIAVVLISAPLYIFFARLSDKVGRKPVMLFGMLLMLALYFPGFHYITRAGNPALDAASQTTPVSVFAYPGDCTFQLDLTGGAQQFATSCDIAKGALSNAGISYRTINAPVGTTARVEIGRDVVVESVNAVGQSASEIRATRTAFNDRLREALTQAGYPAAAPGAMQGWSVAEVLRVFSEKGGVIGIMALFIVAACALYGPQAAALVELFPTRIRYTAMSFPYHIGTGWFGGLLPAIVFAINTATGSIYQGLWFPVIVTALAVIITFFFWPETKDRDIHA